MITEARFPILKRLLRFFIAVVIALLTLAMVLGAISYFRGGPSFSRCQASERRVRRVPTPPDDVGMQKKKDTGLARAKRVEGLSYLEAGKYDKAIAAFSDALRLDSMGELGDLADLMKIAKSLAESDWPAGRADADAHLPKGTP